eukprot:Phypoly_transcript_03737.p1 GENE.Phypoly_transcript_03737~~Phypoly_transcript_03737.p1  ORF type:complete len:679 (+),score=120.09 Phypoly_transcript_03737:217-2253(+)
MEDDDILIEFGAPSFDPDKFTKDLFIKTSERKARLQYDELAKTKESAAGELKKSVYNNYPCFISTSKEISNLEVDMLDLRNLLTDMGSVLKNVQHMNMKFDAPTPSPASRPVSKHISSSQFRDKKVAAKEDVKWLLGVPEELDIVIAERLFDKAVDIVVRLRSLIQEFPHLEVVLSNNSLKSNIDQRVTRLSDALAADLLTPTIRPAYVRVCIARMLRLGLADSAKSIFLESRSKKIRSEIRKLKFEGDIALYVGELSKLVFSSILSTCVEYRQSFTHTSMISGFVVWAMLELQAFGEMFQRQVFCTDNFQVIGQCLQIAEYHCKMLEQKGLSMAFQLWQHIHPGLGTVVDEYLKRLNSGLSKHISEELWVSKLQWVYYDSSLSDRTALNLTDSALYLNTVGQRFANDLCWILTPDLLPIVCSAISSLLEGYMHRLSDALIHLSPAPVSYGGSAGLNGAVVVDKQQLAIVANAVFVVEDLAPRLSNQIKEKLQRNVKELDKMCKKLDARYTALRDTYCIQRARDILDNKMDWSHMEYSKDELDEPEPSQRFVRLVKYLADLAAQAQTLVGAQSVAPIVARIVAEVAAGMSQGKIWDRIETNQAIGFGGLQQLVLDCKFLMVATNNYLIDESVEALQHVIDRAVLAYCTKTGQDPRLVLKPDDWFREGINSAVSNASVP